METKMKYGVRSWTFGLAIAALTMAPTVAQDCGERHGPAHGRGVGPARMARMAEALDLSEKQRVQVRDVIRKYMDGTLAEHLGSTRQARARLDAVIHDAAASDAEVQDAASALSSHAALVAVERHRMVIDIDRLLTAEQKQRAAELRQRRLEARHEFPPEEWDEP